MTAISLTTLRARARERADMVGSSFVADAATGLDAWIVEGWQQLYGKLIDAMGDEYVESQAALTTVSQQSDYNLPADFFKLYGIDLLVAGRNRSLLPFYRANRNALQAVNPTWHTFPKYRITGSKLRLLPLPQAAMTGTIFYAPVASALVNAGDTIDVPNGWETFVVCYAAVQALLKEESDVRPLLGEMARIEAEITRLKDDRDHAFPHSQVDMDAVNLDWRW